jgi:hypothetical protein
MAMNKAHAGALNASLTLAATGLHCLPCAENKRPSTQHGLKDATTDPAELTALSTTRAPPFPRCGCGEGVP